jgi:hypothetical protein
MATISLNLGRTQDDPKETPVPPQETLRIIFHHSGTFCASNPEIFDPPLPNGVFFQKGQTWPDGGEANPNGVGSTTYQFHKSSSPVRCEQAATVTDTASSTVSGFNVIHIP